MDDARLIARLFALGQATRLSVYRLVAAAGGAGMQTGAISTALRVQPNHVSRHLHLLVEAGLLERHVRGRTATYVADPAAVDEVSAAVANLGALARR